MVDQIKYTAKLRGKRLLVVGGSSGIGYAVAEAALENGCEVVISSSNTARVQKAVLSLSTSYPSMKDSIQGYAYDLSDEAHLETRLIDLMSRSGPFDHIVYTAGDTNRPTPISEATLETIKNAATVRYTAPVLMMKHAPKFLNPGPYSSVTLTTGIVIEKPIPNWSVIAGPRSAMQGLVKALALDLRPLRVNLVCVGAVDTDVWTHLPSEQKDQVFATIAAKTTTDRIAQASDVAEAYLYCMRDNNVTGSVIHTNGGALLM